MKQLQHHAVETVAEFRPALFLWPSHPLTTAIDWRVMDFNTAFEQIKVDAAQLVDKVRELIHEGNVRRIIIKDAAGNTFMEIPLNLAVIGVIAAPVLTAVGALAAMAAHFTVVVERNKPGGTPPPSGT
ncbi:MAG TPA: DUF4342 domain-containing protein [Bryobacteraceae bacterium]|nr:DUF4342 domain-containing protein [Bryobacteraceae bacterium]